jgi:hypothetical protein
LDANARVLSEEPVQLEQLKKFLMGCLGVVCVIGATVLGCALLERKIYITGVKHGRETRKNIPRGIVIPPDELVAQLQLMQATNSRKMLDLAASKKNAGLGERQSLWSGREVVLPNHKGAVYVFDSNDGDDQTYVILEVRGCTAGPPLLPSKNEDGNLRWTMPGDSCMHFAMWLAMAMNRLTGEDWSMRAVPYLNCTYLVRYQACIHEEDWRRVWDVLLKPFGQQRTVYRRVRKSSRAPDIFFGVKAKQCEPGEREAELENSGSALFDEASSTTTGNGNSGTGQSGTGTPVPGQFEGDAGDWHADTPPTTDGAGTSGGVITPDTTTLDGSDQSDKSGGIGLPRAADWLDYWQNAEIPQYNTFVDFATDMTEPEFFPRSNSLPPSIGRDSDNEETSSSSKASTPREKIREILRL